MAEHPAITAARKAKGGVYQCTLVLSPHMGPQPPLRTYPTKADPDPTVILSAIAELGWEIVSASPITFAESSAITCIYVFRWVGND